ncbi:hypothetical protein [Pseudomonas petrae]|uniref:Uncharacterized protein n=1 Tax=Pseudomonas petrae TaxID=2912190 RepID=A0ABS9I950_9PSED|nr:hypothetical protein [Pseudomonas petrae]MCF7531000.1 hypothetical protein [Pseudomonas petrae]MCF7536676.1 hypothetical protein [Pseudomonas petrae]MCF7544287.1 hypothetical protein [Pseudomonas petrae]MCF7554355.1 hypothetical protein [Pseudomonas petrae]
MFSGNARNTFAFKHLTDSVINDGTGQFSVDFIHCLRLGATDLLDVSDLGFTGLGDGTDRTFKLIVDTAIHLTYPKDYEADADGHRFEISIHKNVANTFTAHNLIMADASAAHIELVGLAPADLHPIG